MQVYKDPTTGEFTTPPPGALTVTPQAARSTAIVAQPSPGGGTMVPLNGRFRSYITASISPAGELKTQCNLGETPR